MKFNIIYGSAHMIHLSVVGYIASLIDRALDYSIQIQKQVFVWMGCKIAQVELLKAEEM